jgi:hypothetical protein
MVVVVVVVVVGDDKNDVSLCLLLTIRMRRGMAYLPTS